MEFECMTFKSESHSHSHALEIKHDMVIRIFYTDYTPRNFFVDYI